MDSKNKNTIVLIVLFVIALLVGLAGIVFVIITMIDKSNVTNDETEQTTNILITPTPINLTSDDTNTTPTNAQIDKNNDIPVYHVNAPQFTVTNKQIDYNFAINLTGVGIKDDLIPITLVEELNKQSIANSESITRITIAKIGVDAPVVHGVDGLIAIDLGWWMYPASKEQGEKIILAHRRYWRASHPYSAWDINSLPIGAEIILYDKAGNQFKYTVFDQAIVKNTEDNSIYRPSDSDYLKIVTCSTFNGNAGSSSHRYVTLARRNE